MVVNLTLMYQRGCSGGNLKCCCCREGVVVGNLMLMFQRGCSGGKYNADVPERV